ncbi:hypothetical protein RSAG8_01715, partial [Rhizoctonia solani AG-8 WAC10335]
MHAWLGYIIEWQTGHCTHVFCNQLPFALSGDFPPLGIARCTWFGIEVVPLNTSARFTLPNLPQSVNPVAASINGPTISE